MDLHRIRREYAGLIVGTGVNLQEGQPLVIRTEPVQRDFATLLARCAYDMGAGIVSVLYDDPLLRRIRLDRSEDRFLDSVPSYSREIYRTLIDEGWASISLRGPEDPKVMSGADPQRLARVSRAMSESRDYFLQGISSNRISWNVCLHPTDAWAEQVMGDDWDGPESIWEVLLPILRLDAENPAGAWHEQDRELKRRAEYMNEAGFRTIRFSGPGTDLSVGMAPDRLFLGGMCTSGSGVDFFPNIPTEEIFSTPDWRRTQGTVMTTRPVEVLGDTVEGAWFRFQEGRVVEFGAERNVRVLEQYLRMDKGASALGEVALVDTSSPIFSSGRIFHNILLDENAASHIALGNGYTDCIQGGPGMTGKELAETGCNTSLVHTDFMIGSQEVSVFGLRPDGSEECVMENGKFVI